MKGAGTIVNPLLEIGLEIQRSEELFREQIVSDC